MNNNFSKDSFLRRYGKGTSTWISQRASAISLIPLTIYFVYITLSIAIYPDIEAIESIFNSPFTTILTSLFITIGIYHGSLGMKEIIEDYVHCKKLKYSFILMIKFVSIISAISAVTAILILHISTFTYS